MAGDPRPPRVGMGLNPAQAVLIKLAKKAARIFIILGFIIVAARWLSGEKDILPAFGYLELGVMLLTGFLACLILLSGEFWGILWSVINKISMPRFGHKKAEAFTSNETSSGEADFDPTRFNDEYPKEAKNKEGDFSRSHKNARKPEKNAKAEKLIALIAHPKTSKQERQLAIEKLRELRALPAPAKKKSRKNV